MSAVETEEEIPASAEPETKYEFDEEFQDLLTGLVVVDADFVRRTDGLIEPSYLESPINAAIIKIALAYFKKYDSLPAAGSWGTLLKESVDSKIIRKDDAPDVVARLRECFKVDRASAKFVADKVAEFARKKALEAAIFECADLIDRGKYEKVEDIVKAALNVGLSEESNRYDFWEHVETRANYRQEVVAGRIKPTGVTTGVKELDDNLYNKGWGRKELSVLMAPAKGGKSMALIGFGLGACLAGLNVAYITLEVAARIIADRADANLASTRMADLNMAIGVVKTRVKSKQAKAGRFDLYDFPTGTLSPQDLRRLINKKLNQGVKYDLIIVDYADLMRPDVASHEPRENSRLIYIGLRALAQEFDCAVLSATQTNREGFKAVAGRMEHLAEDINKARTVDLLISLNAGEDEREKNEARLYFAASRNQKSDLTIRVKTNFEQAKYIASVIGVE